MHLRETSLSSFHLFSGSVPQMHHRRSRNHKELHAQTYISHPVNLSYPKTAVPPSPSHPTSPPSRSNPRQGTEGTGLPSPAHGFGTGDNRSRGPCRALQLLQGCITNTHTLSPLSTHLGRTGKAHSGPWGRNEATGTVIPQSYTPSPPLLLLLCCRLCPPHVIRQTVSCCITHTPLCPYLRRFQPCP